MKQRVPLSEMEKIEIISCFKNGNTSIGIIASRLGRQRSTIQRFWDSYQLHGIISPKRGRKPKINANSHQEVIDAVTRNPFLSLRENEVISSLSRESIRKIRHQEKINFYSMTPTCQLTEEHIKERIKYCKYMTERPLQPVVFTDESTVQVDPSRPGIWRKRGFHPQESYYVKNGHPIQVMVWGAIGPNGFRTNLVRCPPSVNTLSYCQFLAENRILYQCSSKLGHYIWQQDNAPAHRAVTSIIKQYVPEMVDWPPKSPDLSPIEQIWNLLKQKLRGKNFTSEDELFNALSDAWNNLSNEEVHNYWESYWARCKICLEIGGASLNGHWNEVHMLCYPFKIYKVMKIELNMY